MTSDNCHLNFKEHSENIVSSLSQLRQTQDLCDVTLVSEDGQQLGAHKIILSAGSSFFMQLFKNNPNPHPMIYLRGIKSFLLDLFLNFIYEGETSVSTEILKDFLILATELKVQGLENITYTNIEISPKLKLDESLYNDKKYDKNNSNDTVSTISQEQKHQFTALDYIITHPRSNEKRDTKYETFDDEKPGKSQIEMKIQQKENKIKYRMKNPRNPKKEIELKYACNICGFISTRARNLKRHIYLSHQRRVTPILCTSAFCTQVFDTKDEFLEHKKSCVLRCPWTDCGREFVRLELFENHKRAHKMGRDVTRKVIKQEPGADAEERLKGIWNLIKNKGQT